MQKSKMILELALMLPYGIIFLLFLRAILTPWGIYLQQSGSQVVEVA